ncbi:MAG: Carnitine transport ATP-binding protein OpuCA [Cyanobacteriota bacterium]
MEGRGPYCLKGMSRFSIGTKVRDFELRLTVLMALNLIGYVIQQSGLFPHMTVAQNVAVVPRLLGWNKPEIQARVHHLLELELELELMMEPAHEFVEQLLKRGDLLRQLRVMSVDYGLEPLPPSLDLTTPIPHLAVDSSLRDALTLMLDRGTDLVIVQTSNGKPDDAGLDSP